MLKKVLGFPSSMHNARINPRIAQNSKIIYCAILGLQKTKIYKSIMR